MPGWVENFTLSLPPVLSLGLGISVLSDTSGVVLFFRVVSFLLFLSCEVLFRLLPPCVVAGVVLLNFSSWSCVGLVCLVLSCVVSC